METEIKKILVLSTNYKCRCCLKLNGKAHYSTSETYGSEKIATMFLEVFDIEVRKFVLF